MQLREILSTWRYLVGKLRHYCFHYWLKNIQKKFSGKKSTFGGVTKEWSRLMIRKAILESLIGSYFQGSGYLKVKYIGSKANLTQQRR